MKKYLLFILLLTFVSPVYSLTNYTYTSNSTYTVPSDTQYIFIQVWGGGGQGASCAANAQVGGGGGGGGGYSQELLSVTPGQVFTATVASATNTNNPGANSGPNGFDSVFNRTGIINLTSQGGRGGNSTTGGAGNAGGAGGNGTTTRGGTGGTGGIGNTGVGFGAGGGGGAGTNENGGTGGSTYANVSGGGSGGIGGRLLGGRGGVGAISDAIGDAGVAPGGGGGGAYCDGASSAVRGGFGARGEIRVTEFNSTSGIIVNVYDSLNGSLIMSPVNLTLNGQDFSYYFLNSSIGVFVNNSIPYGVYSAIVNAQGYNPNYVILSVFGQTINIYVDQSSQARLFNIRNAFGQAVSNASVSFLRNINGSSVTYSQIRSDSSGFSTVYLNPNVLYAITATADGYENYTGSVFPNTDQTYVIQFDFSPNPPYVSGDNNTYHQINATFFNSTKIINVTWEVISPIGDLQYFGLSTVYNGTTYSQNISGSPGGGIAFVNISNVNLTVQDTITVTHYFKRNGYSIETFTNTFYFVEYSPRNSSIIGGMFGGNNVPETAPYKALLGMIIVIIVTAAVYSTTKMTDVTGIAAIATVGILTLPSVGVFPLLYGVITVVVGSMLVLVKVLRGA